MDKTTTNKVTFETLAAQRELAAKGPVVGMPATYVIGSDRYAGKISYVSPSGSFVVFEWPAARKHAPERFSRNKSGRYQSKGGRGGFLRLGEAVDYRDPSF